MRTSQMTRPATARSGRPDRLRVVPPAAATYVAAWIVGLLIPTSQLTSDPTAADARARYTDTAVGVALQATLVHAVAGVALAVLVVGLASVMQGRLRSTTLLAGLGAAAVSVSQATLAVVAVARTSVESAEWSLSVLTAINRADTVKLILLAVLATSVTGALHRVSALPGWLGVAGIMLTVLLVIGALSFPAASPVLDAALAASLLLLLAWVGSLGVLVARRRRSLLVATGEVRS